MKLLEEPAFASILLFVVTATIFGGSTTRTHAAVYSANYSNSPPPPSSSSSPSVDDESASDANGGGVIFNDSDEEEDRDDASFSPNFHNNFIGGQTPKAELKKFTNAAIACDSPVCSQIAKSILDKGGAIADAAIAGMLCMGVVHPQSSGIGGGLVAVHYDPVTLRSTVVSARERASLAANESMFDNLPAGSSNVGGLAIAVPAEIQGFLQLYNQFGGKVPWCDLFEPSINLLEHGFRVDSHLALALKLCAKYIKRSTSLRTAFVNPATNKVWLEGDTLKIPELAATFRTIARDGGKTFYDPKSPLAMKILDDLRTVGSIITEQDLVSYSVQTQSAIKVDINNLNLYTAGPPSSGVTMAFILRILEKHKAQLKMDDIETSQILIEAFKHGYGRRGKLGDPDDHQYKNLIDDHVANLTQSEEYLENILKKIKLTSTSQRPSYYQDPDESSRSRGSGTAHLVIVGQNGDALSVTTTIGKFFGAKVRSPQTGIIFNNKMNNFELHPKIRALSPANKIGPGKRPMNTACPSIYADNQGTVRLAIGGAGGMKIISSVVSSTMNLLWFGKNIGQAIATHRLHHALWPMVIDYERGFNKTILNALETYGHKLSEDNPTASVVGITRDPAGNLWATWDPRKPGSVDGF